MGQGWPVRASSSSPAMADGGGRKNERGRATAGLWSYLLEGGHRGEAKRPLGEVELVQERSAVRWRPEEAVRRMAGGVASAQVARDACRREERPRDHLGVLSGPPGSSWLRARRGRGPPAAYRRAAAETEREMEIETFLQFTKS